MCLPFIYLLYACGTTQPERLILVCALGAGSSLTPFTDVALIIGLYLIIKGGGKDEWGSLATTSPLNAFERVIRTECTVNAALSFNCSWFGGDLNRLLTYCITISY